MKGRNNGMQVCDMTVHFKTILCQCTRKGRGSKESEKEFYRNTIVKS